MFGNTAGTIRAGSWAQRGFAGRPWVNLSCGGSGSSDTRSAMTTERTAGPSIRWPGGPSSAVIDPVRSAHARLAPR